MKKRIVALLLSISVFGAFSITSFADNEETLSTGTQTAAGEDVVDIDADIRDELNTLIPEDIEEIKISSADDLIQLAKNCSLDTWSVNKKVILTDDISLVDKDFRGIPSFGGYFDGQGHTISEAYISEGLAYTGLFIHVQKTGVIMNLNVSGTIMPTGNTTIVGGIAGDNYGYIGGCSFKGIVKGKDYIGGITGINELSGTVDYCTSNGFINGVHFTGGIAGRNDGNISNCRNEAEINTTNTDTEITVDSLETLTSVLNLLRDGLNQQDDVAKESITIYDTGGIAGESIGIISRCINNAEIGYDHVGYNVGGIAGRQSGYIYRCSNNGNIKGRKDVGGIAGQAEPFITVDLSSDIAYQLQQAVSKLHDSVTVTLKDAKNQSNVVSNRLAVIQKFTAGAVNDTRYISDGLINYANGVAGSATEAFSRVEYIINETSKDDGVLDKVNDGIQDVKDSAKYITEIAGDTDIESYIDSEYDRQQYNESKLILESASAQYAELRKNSNRVYYNLAIRDKRNNYTSTTGMEYHYDDGTIETNLASWGEGDIGTGLRSDAPGTWVHIDGTTYPQKDNSDDISLEADASASAAVNGIKYAAANYENPITHTKGNYENDISTSTATILGTYEKYMPKMSKDIRSDAQSAMNKIDEASKDFSSAEAKTKDALANVAGRGNITFPQFSSEYRAHTASLADNMQGMNDNFGLLNSEVNNGTGILIDDLLSISDQFNTVLELYTDAIDGILEKDYTSLTTDESYEVVNHTTDATIDSCFNYGKCQGDISVSGIAGTMAIDYDFDKEGAITSIKGNPLNTSYISRCVLRDNRNYGDITSLKDNVGGICGLQEMGTIYNCGSYAKISSSSGDYVGGVAGSSLSHIVKSYAKGELDGDTYVGGIAGDGKHIKECLTIVTVGNASNWYGAIAGHVDPEGEVRDNFFVSDGLAGIDRVSYALKAEPVSYDAVQTNKVFKELEKETEKDEKKAEEAKVISLSTGADKEESSEEIYRELPFEFGNLTVNFMLEDSDLENGEEKVGQLSKKYGDSISISEYPKVAEKEGFYVTWNTDNIDRIVNDVTITATYNRYRTTLADDSSPAQIHQSELLVDGSFKEGDKLVVEKNIDYTLLENGRGSQEDFGIFKITIPDDGSDTHQIRFKPQNAISLYSNLIPFIPTSKFELYQVKDGQKTLLEKTGTMGGYDTYNLQGNDIVLSLGITNFIHPLYIGIGILLILVVILIIFAIVVIVSIKRHGGKLPRFLKGIKLKVSEKIDNKEQIFYDDSEDDLLRKEIKEYKELLKKKTEEKDSEEKDSEK